MYRFGGPMQTQLTTAAAVFVLCALNNAAAQTVSTGTPGKALASHEGSRPRETSKATPTLVGTWTSLPDQVKLTTDFDKPVWGTGASSVRTVSLTIRPSGEGTLQVTRKVVDARGRTVSASTSIEEARLVIGAPQPPVATRIEHAVTVVSAERRYPDDPESRLSLDGLRVKVVTFEGDGKTIEIRFDTPEGAGSFWETLRRGAGSSTGRVTR